MPSLNIPQATLTCGFIGLGSQGGPIARRIIDAGYPTFLWARRQETLLQYRETAAKFSRSIEELGRQADHVGLCVVNDDDVREVTSLLIPVMRKDALIAIHSTIHPDTCREIAVHASARGIRLIDAPVSGGSLAAEAGTLTVMAGADPETFDRALPVFKTFARLVVHLGEVGAGQHVKLINNSLLVANLGLADAALEAGIELGIHRERLIEVLLASSGRSSALEVLARVSKTTGFGHGAALLRKDLKLLGEVLGTNHAVVRCLSGPAARFFEEVYEDHSLATN